jgi:predicted AlkP superfamily pyrophosphatase or phosphodiesterase
MRQTRRLFSIILLALSVLPCFAADKKPKLVVALVVDQFRYDYLTRFRADYHGGIARLLEHGAVFTDAHYPQFPTVTAIGHSTFLSGATPSVSGIIGNEWFDRATNHTVTSVSDDATRLLGGVPGATGSSPNRLLVSTLTDELKMANKTSRVIGISVKDRSSILPAGHMADAAYWFDNESNHFVTSTYYMKDLPAWVKQINDDRPTWKYMGAKWTPVGAGPQDDVKPFCTMTAGTDVRFCGSLEQTPFSNELLEDFAEKAIANEQLGMHEGTDVLALSFSANDYVGHALGPDAPEIRDISIRTDQLLGKLLDFIDSKIGAGNTLVVFTADHGVAPVPEVNQARKMPGGRLDGSTASAAIQDALSAKFGKGNWFLFDGYGFFYLNYDTAKKNNADVFEVRRYAAEVARGLPHIARVYTRDDLLGTATAVDWPSRAMQLGFYGPRSGDLFLLPEPYWMFYAAGTTHSLPYSYDTHVPLIFYGTGIRPGVHHDPVTINDAAPTLATILQVEKPSGCSGRILSVVLE